MRHRVLHIQSLEFLSTAPSHADGDVQILHHFFSRSQIREQSSNSSTLCNCIGAARKLSLQFFAGLCHIGLRRDIPETVTRHGIPFTQAIDDDNTVFYLAELCNAFMPADKIDILIDLIRNNKNVRMLFKNISQRF